MAKKITVKMVDIKKPPEMTREDIRALRKKLQMSQSEFALHLNVSKKTIQAWEQGINKPNGPALRLMEVINMI